MRSIVIALARNLHEAFYFVSPSVCQVVASVAFCCVEGDVSETPTPVNKGTGFDPSNSGQRA